MKYKKRLILIGLLALFGLFFFMKKQYHQFLWSRAVNTPEHKLQVGSFIFSKKMLPDGGSQWYKMNYYIFKVVRIKGDFVRVAAVDQLYTSNNELSADSGLSQPEEYENLKKNMAHITVTGILTEDLYMRGGEYILTEDLKEKYPGLHKSRYYYEEMSGKQKNMPIPKHKINDIENWLGITYSLEHIVKNGELVPYTLTDDFDNYSIIPHLAPNYSIDIEIINNSQINR
ncbi:hypothetical protein [Chryseobacterium sp. M5A1_1a]